MAHLEGDGAVGDGEPRAVLRTERLQRAAMRVRQVPYGSPARGAGGEGGRG